MRQTLRRIRHPRLFAGWGGPLSLAANLRVGLERAGIDHRFNDFARASPHVGVLRGTDALRWAIGRKRAGLVSVLVAGPNIVMLPSDEDHLVCSLEVDRFVVPAEWTRELFGTQCPHLLDRIQVWPVGVDERIWRPDPDRVKSRDVLIYPKTFPPALLRRARAALERAGLRYTLLTYGRYDAAGYRRLLNDHRWMLYLSESESQGIALFEAWACDVPTLVWDRGMWEFGGLRWPATSAPYLAPQAGLSFADEHELDGAIARMEEGRFSPREHVLARHTAERSARAYARIFAESA